MQQEVVGAPMLDKLGDAVFESADPAAILHHDVSHELTSNNGSATLRVAMPFVEKADIELKKIGLDVVVRVGGQKRTIVLPAAMAAYRPRSAKFEDGALAVSFEKEEHGAAAPAE
jgi:arsenite-transporting ATPase